jgi:hypothetical protein
MEGRGQTPVRFDALPREQGRSAPAPGFIHVIGCSAEPDQPNSVKK